MARYDYLQAVMADGRMFFDIGPRVDGEPAKTPDQWAACNADTVHFIHVYSGETDNYARLRHEAQVFSRHNRDDRPRGKEIRSMSVGDVVVIRDHGRPTRILLCRGMGWTEIHRTAGNQTHDRLLAAADRKAHTHLPLTDLINTFRLADVMAVAEEGA